MPVDPPRYRLEVSRGYVRLLREGHLPSRPRSGLRFAYRNGDWTHIGPAPADPDIVDDILHDIRAEQALLEEIADHEDDELRALIGDPHRGDKGLTARSRMNMRRLFVALPWELVGPHPALISLTYPKVWQPWVVDGRQWEVHRRAFERRWVRRWKEPLVGAWVKEFQTSGRPHLHLYVGLPSTMAAGDFEQLRERTLNRHQLERQYGRYEGRHRTPPLALGDRYGSEFGRWLLQAWSETVGTASDDAWQRLPDAKGADYHRTRGADVAVMFWSDETAATADRTRVAQYLSVEAGKFAQKKPPPGFDRVGRYYGVWGRQIGFKTDMTTTDLNPAVALEVEARLVRWVHWKLHILRGGAPPATPFMARRSGDGVTAFGLGPEQAARIVRWSEKAVDRRRATGRQRVAGGAALGDLVALLRTLDLDTGEILAPDPTDPNSEAPAAAP